MKNADDDMEGAGAGVGERRLRRGWTTGACATGALRAALMRLWGGTFPEQVSITLPRGETPAWTLAHSDADAGFAEAGIIKDAGDDPDVTHGAMIVVRVATAPPGTGLRFIAGDGVGTVTKPGLPLPVGAAAINPKPREMMAGVVRELAQIHNRPADLEITVSIPGGVEMAAKTWNPRLGILGGLSVLGTTGIVRPFSCAAWIASIHRGIDVARAEGLEHLAGATGATSEAATKAHHDLTTSAMLDMGDFAGGMLKYLAKNPVKRVTIGGGPGKLAKLALGAMDLHSKRSQVDFKRLNTLAQTAGLADISHANTVLQAIEIAGEALAEVIAEAARFQAADRLGSAPGHNEVDVLVVARDGQVLFCTDVASSPRNRTGMT